MMKMRMSVVRKLQFLNNFLKKTAKYRALDHYFAGFVRELTGFPNKSVVVPILLVCAGMVMTGCPSDPDPLPPLPPPIDSSFKLVDGVYEHEIDNVRINFGKNYEVIIDVEDLDYELGGCHFQGQLLYRDGGITYLLASSQNAQPQNIAAQGKKYRINFTAGKITDEDKSTDKQTAGNYQLPAAGITRVPDSAVQVFKLTAKTPNWYEFGKIGQANNGNDPDNWDVDYYTSGRKPGIKGEITVREKPDITYTDGAAVEVNGGGSNRDPATGKGNIEGDEYTKLKEAPADSLLRVDCTANVVTSGGGGTSAQPGWGIAELGTAMDQDKIRGQNPNVSVGIPTEWNGTPVTANSDFSFYVDILIDDILAASDEYWTFLNVYNGGKVLDMKIRVPDAP